VAAIPAATEPQALTAAGTPDWVGEIWHKYSTRVLDYFRQAFSLLRGPGRFMEEWATGQREALNPLRFLGLGFLLSLTARHLGEWSLVDPSLKVQGPTSIIGTFFGAELIFVVLALPMHGVMRLSGSRAPLSATAAAIIYAFMGPVVLLQALGWLASALLLLITGSVPLFPLKPGVAVRVIGYSAYPWPLMVSNWLSLVYCVRALAGVHRGRWGWAIVALIVAHGVFMPFIAFVTQLNVHDFSSLVAYVKGWLGRG
jgi:hypothetical protein